MQPGQGHLSCFPTSTGFFMPSSQMQRLETAALRVAIGGACCSRKCSVDEQEKEERGEDGEGLGAHHEDNDCLLMLLLRHYMKPPKDWQQRVKFHGVAEKTISCFSSSSSSSSSSLLTPSPCPPSPQLCPPPSPLSPLPSLLLHLHANSCLTN
eukprot:761299-Hanusia_phi.AAC.1